jgi:hypothetical protein
MQYLFFVSPLNLSFIHPLFGIFGCPHEEGIDYPEVESCSQRPFLAGRNRATGNREH